jgi:hypothetical protein
VDEVVTGGSDGTPDTVDSADDEDATSAEVAGGDRASDDDIPGGCG